LLLLLAVVVALAAVVAVVVVVVVVSCWCCGEDWLVRVLLTAQKQQHYQDVPACSNISAAETNIR
jgi:hypothetical protein